MTKTPDRTLSDSPSLKDQLSPDTRYKYQIPVDLFGEYYGIKKPEVQEALQEHPTLSYLLGRVTAESQGMDNRPDGVLRPVYFLEEGSAMFALEKKDDAMRWKGIFNHIMETARQVYYLSTILKDLSPEQRQQLTDLGFDLSSFNEVEPELLRDFMFISHSGRRSTDETTWHNLKNDGVHGEIDPGRATFNHLRALKASPIFLDLMRVEKHADHLAKVREKTIFPDIIDNLLTYPDWTFGQSPNTLQDRFIGLRRSQRAAPEILDLLEKCGLTFEKALQEVVSPTIWQKMTSAGPFAWETQIRKAYCAPSGLTVQETFPGYLQQFPQAV